MADQSLTLRRPSDGRAEEMLASALRKRSGAITRADAVALTGLPVDQTESALKSLLSRYRSHLAVTDSGELIYRFEPGMVRRDAPTLGERIAAAGALAWTAFSLLFKVWIAATLVIYVTAFVAMLIALTFTNGNDRDNRRGGGAPWLLYWMMPGWAPPSERRRLQSRGPTKPFYRSVFDYVFGPPPAKGDGLDDSREVVAYLRARGGRLSTTDLVALTGWSYARAEEEATRLLADYDGEPEVQSDGTIVYSFPQLRITAGASGASEQALVATERWRYDWQDARALPHMTGNTPGTDAAVTGLNFVNLVGALAIAPAFLAVYGPRWGIPPALGHAVVTTFPLVFSAIFYAVPGARWLRRRRLARRLEAGRARGQLLRQIIEGRGRPELPDELIARALPVGGGEPERALLRSELEILLRDLDGDAQSDDEGRLRYRFPRVAEELAAVDEARALAPAAEKSAGQVVFSSDDEGAGEALPEPARPAIKLLH